MGSWTIYSKDRTPKYTVKELEYHDTWMGEEYVIVSITSPTPLELAIGDYLVYRGLTYSVYSVPGALKQARKNTYGEAFKYDNVKLSSRGTELTDIRFLDYVLDDNNIHYTSLPTFAFYAETVDDLLDRLQANTDREGVQWLFISPSYNRTMQRYEQGTPAYQEAAQLWEQYFGGSHEDPVYEKTNVNISIDKQSVWDGLAPIKNDFGLNFFSRERAVIVGGEGMPAEHVFHYGKGNGLYQIERIADQDQKVTTKLYAYGSDKNLPIRYYANITRICFAYLYARPSVDSNILYLDFVWNRSYVTGAADSEGKFPVVVSIAGVTYNVKAYPMEVGARTLFTIEASVSLGFVTSSMEIDFVSGIDKDKFPASNVRQESGALPNNMAVQVLMLPGFPQYSLADLCRCTYNGEQTVLEIRKTPSESYNEFMRIEGNHPVTFSNDPLQPYILSGNVDTIGIKEGDVHFVEDNDDNGLKEIYPSIEGMTRGDVEGTSSTERLDEIVSCDVIQDNGVFGEGVKIENFNLVLKDIGFDLKDAFDNAGGNMTLSMKDGYCGGRDFSVHSVTSIANGQWRLNVERSHDEGLDLWFPYSTNAAIGQTPTADEPYQIRTGDHFVLTEIEIGDTSYIWAAAMKMLRKSITYLLNNDYTRFTYLPKVDEIYMARQHDESQTQVGIESLHDTLKSGMLMLFEDEDLDVDGSVFIDSLTIKENGNNGIPTYDVVLRNDKQVGTMQRIQNQINSLTSYIGGGGGGLSVSQIRSLINSYGGELFLSKVNADIAAGRITFQQGMEALVLSVFNGIRNNGRITSDEADIPRFVSDTTIDGILHVLAKIVANQIESDNFNGDGPFDTGFELTKSDGNGYSYLVVDKLFVRLKAIFNELEVRKISYSGGNFIFSHAGSHIVYVKELQLGVGSEVEGTVLKLSGAVDVADNVLNVGSGSVSGSTLNLSSDKRVYAYRCYIMKDDGTTATENWWRVDDQARCQTFNVVEPGHYENVENTSYWRRVIAVGHEKVRLNDSEQEQEYDYVDLSLNDCMQGSDIPKAGDQIVQMGNRTDAERQGFISLEVAGEYAPAFKVYKGVNYYTLDGKRKICISPKLTDIRAQKFTIETEYDTRLMPMERGDWSRVAEHKCYYYNLVQHNGATWLCVCPEGEYTTEEPSETATYWRPYAQKGKDGKDGKSFNILGSYDTEAELIATHPTGSVGDAYMVAGDLYVWDEVNTRWHNSGRIQGDAGRGIASAEIVYGVSENPATLPTEWESSPAELTIGPGDFLFVRTILSYDDGTDAAPYYSISRFGVDGSFKQTAFTRTNKNISSQQLSGKPLPNDFVFDGETIHFSDGIPTGEKRVWATSNIFYGDGTQSGWTPLTPMTDTSTFDVEFSPNETKPADPSDNESQREAQGWYDPTRNPSHDFSTTIWRAERQKKNGEWGAWAIEKVKGEKGEKGDNGRGITSVNTYFKADSATTPATPSGAPSETGWSDDGNSLIIPANANKHLYESTCTAYSDGTYSWTTPIDDGLISDMASTAEEFALSDSNTTAPTSGWASSVNPIAGKWIWSRTVLTFKSGNPTYTNTQCVGYCGTNGKDGADSVTTTLSTQTVEIPTDTDGVCLEDTQVELSARLFVGSKEVKVTDIVMDEQSSQRVTSVVKSTLDMMPWATSSDASVQGKVITFSRNASVQGTVLTIGGDAFNVTPSKVVVTIAKGTVVNEHTVSLRVTGVDEDKTTHYGFAAFNVQRHYIPVDGQNAINIIVTPAALIVNQSLQNPDNLSQLSEEIIFSATMGDRQVAVNKVEITSAEHCTVEGSNGNKATVRAIGTYTEEGSHYYFDKANFICKVTTAYGTIEGIKVDVYANLLGTWKETVEADTKTEVARSLTYGYDPEAGEVIPIENFGSFIKSSEENISTISKQINDPTTGLVTQISTIDQKADRISLNVEAKENVNLVPDPDIYQMLASAITRNISLVKDRTYTLTARLKNTSSTATSCTIDIASLTTLPCSLAAGAVDNFSKTFTAPATGTFILTVPQTANVLLEWLQVEQGSAFTKHDNIGSAFQRTGIDIENGTIRLQADKVTFTNSAGTVSDKIWIDPTYGTLHAVNGDFSGKITATDGTIGGFSIGQHSIKSSNDKIILNDDGTATIGSMTVAADGKITATSVDMSGKITATDGTIGGFKIGSKDLTNTAYDASVVIQNAASNPTQIARIGKSAVDSMTNQSCSLQAESKVSGTYNTALYLNATNATYNYAFHGNGNGVLNGLMFGYKTQYKTIPSGSIDRLDYIYLKDGATTILKGTHSSGHVIMASPSISEVRQCLGLSTSDTTTPFAIEVTYINLSDYTEVHIGFRGNTLGGELGTEYPFLMNNDNHWWATSLQIAKGDLIKLMLLYAPSIYGTGSYEYRAQVVVRQADV